MFDHRQSKRSLGSRVVVLGVVAIAAAPRTAGAGQPDDQWGMFPGKRIAIDSTPAEVVAGDLNGDGKPDLVVASGDGPRVLLGEGGNRFAPMVQYHTPINVTHIELGDLDGDGDLDIVTTSIFFRTAVVLLNDGDGVFTSQISYGFIDPTRGLTLGDWDGDGDLDIAVCSYNGLALRLNQGDGTFSSRVTIQSSSEPASITSGDIDGDGDTDIVGTSRRLSSSQVCVWRNLGIGVFIEQACIAAPRNPERQSLGDLDGDGDLDLAFVSSRDDSACFMLNDGTGVFTDAVCYPLFNITRFGALADLDNDGDLDYAASIVGQNALMDQNIGVLLNHGDGSFADAALYFAGRGPTGIAAADLDGDGDLDLAVGNDVSGIYPAAKRGIVALRNTGSGSFETTGRLTGTGFVLLGEMNGDDRQDLVRLNAPPLDRAAHVLLADGEGAFEEALVTDTGSTGSLAALGDLDGDGDTDLLKYNDDGGTIDVLLNDGNGTLGAPRTVLIDLQDPETLSIGDLDNDGDLDLAVADYRTQMDIYLNSGDADFGVPIGLPNSEGIFESHLIDFDGDGDRDIVTATGTLNAVGVEFRLNNGSGAFAAPFMVEVQGSLESVAFGDFDLDGDLDFVTRQFCCPQSFIEVFRTDADGTYTSIGTYAVGIGGGQIGVDDLDGDGVADLVITNGLNNDLIVLLGNGDGTFAPESRYALGWDPYYVALGDLNGDGGVDIATGGTRGPWWFLENRLAAPAPCSAADLAEPIGLLDLADLTAFVVAFTNGDNDADLDNNGTFDLNDLVAFVEAFVAGCP